MEEIKLRLIQLLIQTDEFLKNNTDVELSERPSIGKWSKKEILGHLVDSAVNNLQRFTEIQFDQQPYQIRVYDQQNLVRVNNYQNNPLKDTLNLWLALNKQILNVFISFTDETAALKLLIDDKKEVSLLFWMNDYVQHMDHHVKQILHK